MEVSGLPLPDADITTNVYHGFISDGQTGFEFHYPNDPGDVAIVVQCGGTANGSSNWRHTNGWPTDHWEDETTSSSTASGVEVEFNADECTIIRTDSSYTIQGTRTDVTSFSATMGTGTTTRTITLNAVLSLKGLVAGVGKKAHRQPFVFRLSQNFPNPFNPSTVIGYQLPTNTMVTLKIYDVLGREVRTMVNERQSAGNYSVTLTAGNLPSGVYFCRLQAGSFTATKKLALLK